MLFTSIFETTQNDGYIDVDWWQFVLRIVKVWFLSVVLRQSVLVA